MPWQTDMIKKFIPIFEEKKYRASGKIKKELESLGEEREKVEKRINKILKNFK